MHCMSVSCTLGCYIYIPIPCLSMLRVNSDMFSQCCYAGHAQYNSYTERVCLNLSSIWTLWGHDNACMGARAYGMHSLVPRPVPNRKWHRPRTRLWYACAFLNAPCHQVDVPQVIMNNFTHVLCSIYYISSALDTIQQTDNFWSNSECVRVQI